MSLPASHDRTLNLALPLRPHAAFHHSDGHFAGVISEVVYSEDRVGLTELMLLPLLQQLGQQSRWQLWLTPCQKLSRQWLQSAGLPLSKVMQVNQVTPLTTVETMAKAMRTGNYSAVIGWLPHELSDHQHNLLNLAASEGQTTGLILRPVTPLFSGARPRTGLKIHSSLYH
ncbi:cell division inhibitor SulA [Erwinia sp. CPCC 100877]|nr:cell division inhibitor SulA [Erwinia sp. CPCC 100877]